VICVILGLAVLVEHLLVSDRQMDRQTHDDGKYRASIASCGLKLKTQMSAVLQVSKESSDNYQSLNK